MRHRVNLLPAARETSTHGAATYRLPPRIRAEELVVELVVEAREAGKCLGVPVALNVAVSRRRLTGKGALRHPVFDLRRIVRPVICFVKGQKTDWRSGFS